MEIIFNNKQKENLKLEDLTAVYRKLFLGNKEGQIVLDDLSQKARICMPVFSHNSSEILFIEGMRNLFCYIVSFLEEKTESDNFIKDYDPFQH